MQKIHLKSPIALTLPGGDMHLSELVKRRRRFELCLGGDSKHLVAHQQCGSTREVE